MSSAQSEVPNESLRLLVKLQDLDLMIKEAAVQQELPVQNHLQIGRSLEVDDSAVLAHCIHVDAGSEVVVASFEK